MRRSPETGELLLMVLRLLERREMPEGQILVELRAQLGVEYRVTAGEVFITLEALTAERLIEASTVGASVLCRITRRGLEAVARRADSGRVESCEPVRVAILFTDLVGSTALMDRLGDDEAHRVRRRHFVLLRQAIDAQGGREVKNLGDGLMVKFDDAPAAVACALAMQRAVSESDDPLELRIGIASGETVREDDDYFGRPVIVARRLCDAASGGEVLVAEPARTLMAGARAEGSRALAPLMLRGFSEPVTASAVRERSPAMSA